MKFTKEDMKAGKHMAARRMLGKHLSKIRMRDGPYHISGVSAGFYRQNTDILKYQPNVCTSIVMEDPHHLLNLESEAQPMLK